ncbi:MBL fold metallo-hydrolase [Paenibacillus sp. HN-1]|uniref:MBL fold metallo-hydrolase n=1 Tax=Paenibacillus TaxID=44249 RepID=UPI001CAA3738|nr:MULTISPECIES: MBL fold metallo-hydrolase [Paenibacillus]MBY9081439.1 MBL fold metallo-hydrolase [Paenibacillus sp. CGMCC 1.18879]MBY9084959.1 MBL fold metallo-hydrolase [Paenibacillus sinensis]
MTRSGKMLGICVALMAAASLQACVADNSPKAEKPAASADQPAVQSANVQPKKVEVKWNTEIFNNTSGKTMIKCVTTPNQNHMSFAIVSSKGTVIIAEPNRLNYSNGLLHADVITSSVNNHDHRDGGIIKANPEARVSEWTAESFTVKDVKVTGIPASYTNELVKTESPSEVIYLYEVDGLRIAYTGALGQDELTAEQLKQLGRIDVLIQYFNDAPTWHIQKETAVNVISQLKAPIVLASEYSKEAAAFIMGGLQAGELKEQDVLLVDKEDITSIKSPEYIYLK